MDTSETYIKMCEKAGEIQEYWELHRGDYYKLTCPSNLGVHQLRATRKKRPDASIWLPRQDQLQEMVTREQQRSIFTWDNREAAGDWEWENLFKKWAYEGWSWEQLWLAFVMKEKYNKTWDLAKEDWI